MRISMTPNLLARILHAKASRNETKKKPKQSHVEWKRRRAKNYKMQQLYFELHRTKKSNRLLYTAWLTLNAHHFVALRFVTRRIVSNPLVNKCSVTLRLNGGIHK